jgi:hemerythrin
VKILKLLRQHIDSEETVMDETGFTEHDLHKKYHRFSLESFETVLQMFDQAFLQEHLPLVVDHFRSRLSEEIFVDRLFATFLQAKENSTA